MRELTLTLTLTRLHYKGTNYFIADIRQASASDKKAFYKAFLPPALLALGCRPKRVLAGTGPRVCA